MVFKRKGEAFMDKFIGAKEDRNGTNKARIIKLHTHVELS